jgi:alkane 1-monooxygenase
MQNMTLRTAMRLKKFGYILFLLPPSLPFLAYLGAQRFGAWDAWSFLVPVVFFVLIPIADWLIGQDHSNPLQSDEAALKKDRFYPVLLLACLPLQLAMLVFGAWVLEHAPFSWLGKAMWVVSVGMVGGVTAINTGHELIHKSNRWLQRAGGALLATVGYASFKVEHIYGHHIHVATARDNSTAKLGENVYGFIARAFAHNLPQAFVLERANVARRGEVYRWYRSELTGWYVLTGALCAAFTAVWGIAGLVFFIGQCIFAVSMLEIVNYLEHYGLTRTVNERGVYERVDPTHSWNSNYLLTNLLLFQLQRHSDHHAFAARPYQTLRHFDFSPQLPAGYATMVVLALLPPLWRKVMDPRAVAYNQGRALLIAQRVRGLASPPDIIGSAPIA